MVNIGDVIFQILMFVFIVGIFFAVFFLVKSLFTKPPKKSDQIEKKLDRIIELLERDKKE